MTGMSLTQTEYAIVQTIGQLRFKKTSEATSESIQSKKLQPIEIVIDGVLTEYVLSRILNLSFDLNCDYRAFGADLISHNGVTIDVKSTRKYRGPMNAPKWSVDKPADIFVASYVGSDRVSIVGWAEREEFLRKENLKDVGEGPFYSLPIDRLHPFETLKEIL